MAFRRKGEVVPPREPPMSNVLTSRINDAIRDHGLPYTAHFIPSHNPETDDDIELRLAGQSTRWRVQVGPGYLVLNEHEFENGELMAVHHHDAFTRDEPQRLIAKLLDLLSKEG